MAAVFLKALKDVYHCENRQEKETATLEMLITI